MAVSSPSPVEVNTFKFIQLRILKVLQNSEGLPSGAINVVATSSRHGLIFIGLQDGFKVLKVENILDLDEDKQNFRIPADNYACQKVSSPPPVLLSLSADDMTLAVCVLRNSRLVADMYDIRAFADPDEIPAPFMNVQLSSQCTELKDFMWNPVVSEMYAFCLGDGAVHVHELSETTLKIVADLPPATGATAVCWSPKGKQLVIGKKDGSLGQYKPTLQEVKKIPPPVLDENNLEVLNVCWLTTTLFATAYVSAANDPDKLPSLVFVSTPKGVPVSYVNCADVCMGGTSPQALRYTMHHQSEWSMLICSSSTSIETAVVGCVNNSTTWLQWNLEDSGRADLPLDRDIEPYPLGMGIIHCAQRRIVISDMESYPPMPLLFLLSSNGLLCPFHMLNTKPGAANLVFPSEPICRDGERKRQGSPIAASPSTIEPQNRVIPTVISMPPAMSIAPAASSPPTFGMNRMENVNFSFSSPATNIVQVGAQSAPVLSPQALQLVTPPSAVSTLVPQNTLSSASQFQGFSSTPKSVPSNQPSLFGAGPFSRPPTSGASSLTPLYSNRPTEVPLIPPAPVFSTPIATMTQQPGNEPPVPPKTPALVTVPRAVPEEAKKTEISAAEVEKYTLAIINEIRQFDTELQNLKNKVPDCNVGTKEEMGFLKKNLLLLTDVNKELTDSMQSLNLDVHGLKTASLESFSMVGEAKSRQQRRNDPNYNMLLQDRALDPISAKRMQKIQKLYQYLNCQLQETNERLDQDLLEFSQKRKLHEKNSKQVHSAEAIYQTIINNQNIIQLLNMNFQSLADLYRQQKKVPRLNYSINGNDSSDVDLSQLAETLLQDKSKFDVLNENLSRPARKKLPSSIQSALRDALSHRKITCVKPTVIEHPSQSRLLSSTMLHIDKEMSKLNVEATSEAVCNKGIELDISPIRADSSGTGNVLATPLEVKPLSAFTARNANPGIFGGITQGIPIATGLPRPLPTSTPQVPVGSQEANTSFAVSQFFDPSQTFPKSVITSIQQAEPSMYEDITPPSSPEKSFTQGSKQPAQTGNEAVAVPNALTSFSFTPVSKMMDGAKDANKFAPSLGSSLTFGSTTTPFSTAGNIFMQPFQIISPENAASDPNAKSPNLIFAPLGSKVSEAKENTYQKDTAIEDSVSSIANSAALFSFNHGKQGSQPISAPVQTLTHIKVIDETTKAPKPPIPTMTGGPFFTIGGNAVNEKNATPSSASKTSASLTFGGPSVFGVPSFASPQINSIAISKEKSSDVTQTTTTSSCGNMSVFGQQLENSSSFLKQRTSSSIFGNIPQQTMPVTTTEPTAGTQSVSAHGFITSFGSPSTTVATALSPIQLTTSQSAADIPNTETASVLSQSSAPSIFATTGTPSSATTGLKSTFTFGQPSAMSTTLASPFVQTAINATAGSPIGQPATISTQTAVADTTTKSLAPFSQIAPASASSTGLAADSTKPIFTFVQAATTSSATSTFGQTSSTTNVTLDQISPTTTSVDSFGQTATTTTAPGNIFSPTENNKAAGSIFGQPAITTTSGSLFGQPATTTAAGSLFGPPSTTTAAGSLFGQPATTTAPGSLFGQPATTTTADTLFGQISTTTATGNLFSPTATTTASNLFSQTVTTTTTVTSPLSFDQTITTSAVSPFGQPSSPVSAAGMFGQAAAAVTSFGQNATSPFGQTAASPNASPFGQTGFLGAATPGSLFGQKDQTSSSSIFGGQSAAAGFSFGKPSGFGQSPPGSFGLAKAVFGQSPSPPSLSFGQPGDSSVFGLGGKPSEQNASKNVFGGSISTSPTGSNTALFGNQGATTFGSKPAGSFSGGSFSTGSGSVAQSGFGAFQQSPQKPAGFGAPAQFGGSPTFGSASPPAGFGAPAAFGSSQPASPFAGSQSSFSSFANADAPSFGSLASQTGSFTGMPQQSPPQGSVFGSNNNVFGGAASPPSFGSPPQQQSGFGSPSSSGGSSAFSQWRS